jgi:hypothetical protein
MVARQRQPTVARPACLAVLTNQPAGSLILYIPYGTVQAGVVANRSKYKILLLVRVRVDVSTKTHQQSKASTSCLSLSRGPRLEYYQVALEARLPVGYRSTVLLALALVFLRLTLFGTTARSGDSFNPNLTRNLKLRSKKRREINNKKKLSNSSSHDLSISQSI